MDVALWLLVWIAGSIGGGIAWWRFHRYGGRRPRPPGLADRTPERRWTAEQFAALDEPRRRST